MTNGFYSSHALSGSWNGYEDLVNLFPIPPGQPSFQFAQQSIVLSQQAEPPPPYQNPSTDQYIAQERQQQLQQLQQQHCHLQNVPTVPQQSYWTTMPPGLYYNQVPTPPSAGNTRMIEPNLEVMPTTFLGPAESLQRRPSHASRSQSFALASPRRATLSRNESRSSSSEYSRSVSPSPANLSGWGFTNEEGTWSCAFPGCASRAKFNRGCDLRKHYKRHMKSFFCRHEGCPQSTGGGFSSKKDRTRHEAKHNPGIVCEWEDCDRLFSRMDNMRDHVRRIHRRKSCQ